MDATIVLGSKCMQLDLAVPGAQAVGPTYIFGCEVEMLVNEGESPSLKIGFGGMKEKPRTSCRHPKGWGMGGPPMQNGPCVGVKKPQNGLRKRSNQATPYAPWASQWIGAGWEQPRAHEKGPVGRKKPQNGLRERKYQATPYAPWASQRIGAGWEQPRARKKGPVGRKKPQNELCKRSIGCIHCSLGCIHGSHVTIPWTHPCRVRWLQPTHVVATKPLV
ncbi:hypothetical protein B0H14DRAFT_2632743 [Mycena olivaceomarginata]|nr:hypothetical protein B0H14DRAFT_2632743 [Mycena olivaceomarginata]